MKKFLFIISLFSLSIYAEVCQDGVCRREDVCTNDNTCSEESVSQRLVNLMFNRDQMRNVSFSFMQQFLRQMPADSQKNVPAIEMMVNRMVERLSSSEVVEEIAASYTKHLSKEQVNELLNFYESETGRRVLQVMPAISADCCQIGLRVSQEVMAEYMPQENNNVCVVEK